MDCHAREGELIAAKTAGSNLARPNVIEVLLTPGPCVTVRGFLNSLEFSWDIFLPESHGNQLSQEKDIDEF
jgi:hypothetical protein